MAFESLEEIVERCKRENKAFYRVVMEEDIQERNIAEEDSLKQMKRTWEAMLLAADTYEPGLKSHSGLVGGDGAKMSEYGKAHREDSLCGSFVDSVIAGALQMGESNACMKRIVAAPTAGACGVLPAVLVPSFRTGRYCVEEMLQAMYTAAGIGQVIAARAYISGAAGGCQAEIGAASAMAAGALVSLWGGSPQQITEASAMALKNLLGLVCDPVAGLVEVPCVKRNVVGAMNALSSAEMALAGITSRIPPDQVIDAMKEVGDRMDEMFRETAKGGLAATPAGKTVAGKMSE